MQTSEQLIKQLQLLTDWYLSVLDNIKDQDGSKTINDQTNSLEWIAGHLITGRYRNLVRLGVKTEPYKYLDKFVNQAIPPPSGIAFDKKSNYPTLTECKEQWKSYSNTFLEALRSIDERILKTEIPFHVLTGGNTVSDALVFTVLHETYHIGQMSIIRKSIGYGPMQLSPRK
jgi:uncharacterized damage-inducible protein DinB